MYIYLETIFLANLNTQQEQHEKPR